MSAIKTPFAPHTRQLTASQIGLLGGSMRNRCRAAGAPLLGNPGIPPHRESMVVNVSDPAPVPTPTARASRSKIHLRDTAPLRSKHLDIDFAGATRLRKITFGGPNGFRETGRGATLDEVIQQAEAKAQAFAWVGRQFNGSWVTFFVPIVARSARAVSLKALRNALAVRGLRFLGSTLCQPAAK